MSGSNTPGPDAPKPGEPTPGVRDADRLRLLEEAVAFNDRQGDTLNEAVAELLKRVDLAVKRIDALERRIEGLHSAMDAASEEAASEEAAIEGTGTQEAADRTAEDGDTPAP